MKTLIILSVFLLPYCMHSQVRYYYDAVQSTVFNNPANIGAGGSANLRASYNDHDTGAQGIYKRANFFFDQGRKLKNNNILAYGVGFHSDWNRTASGGLSELSIALAYHKLLGSSGEFKHYLAAGAALTGNNQSVNEHNLRWPSELDPNTGFDPDRPSIDGFNSTIQYIGIDLGLLYTLQWKDQYIKAGVSYQDLNRPNVSFFGYSHVRQPTGHVISLLGKIAVSRKWYMEPQLRFFDFRLFSRLHIGSNVLYQASKKFAIVAGLASHEYGFYSINAGCTIGESRAIITYGWKGSDPLPLQQLLEFSISHRFVSANSVTKINEQKSADAI